MKQNDTIVKLLKNTRYHQIKIEQLNFVYEALKNMNILDMESFNRKANIIIEYLVNVHNQSIDDAIGAYTLFKAFLIIENLPSATHVESNTIYHAHVEPVVKNRKSLNFKIIFKFLRQTLGGDSHVEKQDKYRNTSIRSTSYRSDKIVQKQRNNKAKYGK